MLEPQAEGGFSVSVSALPEAAMAGNSEGEALEMGADAIRRVLEYRRAKGIPIPNDAAPTVRKVTVAA